MKTPNADDPPLEALLTAARFAAEKHSKQRRKNSEASPYINHPITVAEVLARIGRIDDLAMLQAALLHDTLEDTETTAEELKARFGEEVLEFVKELTDDKSLPKQDRKRLQIEHAPQLSLRARQIKLADKICNVADINATQPMNWPLERKREYFDWAEKVVAGCRGSNWQLEEHFDAVLKAQREAIEKG